MKNGFSLIEVMVGTAIFSSLSLILLKGFSLVNNGQQQLSFHAQLDLHAIELEYIFKDYNICKANFNFGANPVVKNQLKIVNSSGDTLIKYPKIYNKFRIDEYLISPQNNNKVILKVSKKTKNGFVSMRSKIFSLNFKNDSSGKPVDCIDEKDIQEKTFFNEVVKRTCKDSEFEVKKIGGKETRCLPKKGLNKDHFKCKNGEALHKIELVNNNNNAEYIYQCKKGGTCPDNQISLSKNGMIQCFDKCKNGTMGLVIRGELKCMSLKCPAGSYISRVRESGVECRKLIGDSSVCERFKLVTNNSGELVMECL